MNQLVQSAITKADKVRSGANLSMVEPANAIDICLSLGIEVKFENKDFEGFYFREGDTGSSSILLGSLRPYPRRIFSCAHELGHFAHGHGTKLHTADEHDEKAREAEIKHPDEIQADAFAAALLMPYIGVQSEFIKRGWKPTTASPLQYYIIASLFGVGYETLISNCVVAGTINGAVAKELRKQTPAKILKSLLGKDTSPVHFKVFDGKTDLKYIDLETNNYLIIPSYVNISDPKLEFHTKLSIGTCYRATSSGTTVTTTLDNSFTAMIRIQPFQFSGYAEYRFFENNDNFYE